MYVGSAPTGTDNHEGVYETLIIKNGSGDEIVKFNLTEKQGNNVVNEGDSALSGTNASYIVLPQFLNTNYGYISATSPRDGTEKSGWLMKMKRSPLNKIANLTLLEKA